MPKTPAQLATEGRTRFANLAYPGRVIGFAVVEGKDGKQKLAAIYAITGRSTGRGGTANRLLIASENMREVRAEFAIEPPPELAAKRDLYEYLAAVRTKDGVYLANGNHIDKIIAGDSQNLITDTDDETYEDDGSKTSRIFAVAYPESEIPEQPSRDFLPFLQFGRIRKAPDSESREVILNAYHNIVTRTARLIHTYGEDPEDPDALPPFTGDPHLAQIVRNDAASIAYDVWGLLAPKGGAQDLRVCIMVQMYDMGKNFKPDDEANEAETFIYNRYSDKDPGPDSNVLTENPPFEDPTHQIPAAIPGAE